MNITPNLFEQHLQWLTREGYTSILPADIPFIKTGYDRNKKHILITFDDGNRSVYKYAFPLMQKYNFKGIVFLINDAVQTNENRTYLNIAEIKELRKAGWEMGCHSMSHARLDKADLDTLLYEINRPKFDLEKKIGTNIYAFAYPYGIISQNIINLTKLDYNYGFMTLGGNNEYITNFYQINRHIVFNSTDLEDLQSMLRSKLIPLKLQLLLEEKELQISLQVPSALEVKNIKILFNYKIIDRYELKDNQITFSIRSFYRFNSLTVYLTGSKNNPFYFSRMINIRYLMDVY